MRSLFSGCMVALVAISFPLVAVDAKKAHVEVGPSKCPAIGTAKGAANQELNRKKNRETAPSSAEMDGSVTLAKMLGSGDDNGRFDEGKGAVIEGYVVNVQQGGHPETANCGDLTKQDTDTHITVGATPHAAEIETMIVEVTPRWRVKVSDDWSTDTLQSTLIGKKVQFKGWLLFDTDHIDEAVNTAPAGTPICASLPKNSHKKCIWRKTVWEIHPITEMHISP